MPLQVAPKQIMSETIYQFLGLNLAVDPELIGQAEVAEALNADFHTKPGMARARLGQNLVVSDSGSIERIQAFNDGLAYVAGQTLTVPGDTETGLQGLTTFMPYEPFNTDTPSLYVANETRMLRADPSGIYAWGLLQPTSPAVLVNDDGLLTGRYSVRLTYVRKEGSALIEESTPSTVSEDLNLADQGITVVVAKPIDPQITNIRLYRTVANGTVHLLDREIPSVSGSFTLTKPDSGLGAALSEDNAMPPISTGIACLHNDRFWLFDETTAYYSDKFRGVFSFFNYLEITSTSDPIVGAISHRGVLGVFTSSRKFRIVEQVEGAAAVGADLPFFGGSTAGYVPVESPSARGAVSHKAICGTEAGVAFVARDGLYITDFTSLDTPIGETVKPLFMAEEMGGITPIRWSQVSQINLAYHKRALYLSYAGAGETSPSELLVYSFSTQRFTRYSQVPTAMHWDTVADTFYYGTVDGDIYSFERIGVYTDGSNPISMSFRLGERNGQAPMMRKQFRFLRVDATVPLDEALSVLFYVDGTLKATYTFSGNKQLFRLPASSQGYTYSVEFSIASASLIEIKGLEVSWLPMHLT